MRDTIDKAPPRVQTVVAQVRQNDGQWAALKRALRHGYWFKPVTPLHDQYNALLKQSPAMAYRLRDLNRDVWLDEQRTVQLYESRKQWIENTSRTDDEKAEAELLAKRQQAKREAAARSRAEQIMAEQQEAARRRAYTKALKEAEQEATS